MRPSIPALQGRGFRQVPDGSQVTALKKLYAGTHDSKGHVVYPCICPASKRVTAALKAANERNSQALNATDPYLKPFKARGGTLILYHGWNDPGITALNTIDYYESVIKEMGQKDVDSFVRLYMRQACNTAPEAQGRIRSERSVI
jgi:tannase/feruloyl esterase